jgi:hypothetical protein
MDIWQVAAGDSSRDYSDVFLKFGVLLIGAGGDGSYFSNPGAYNDNPAIREFAEDVEEGDLVVLKRPSNAKCEIVAVGKVVSPYLYKDVFGNVDGFWLHHCRKVCWKRPATAKRRFVCGLRQRARFCRVKSIEAQRAAKRIWETGRLHKPIRIPPKPPHPLSLDQLRDFLKVERVELRRARRIAATIRKLQKLGNWYEDDVSEYDTRTFLIVPLLISLGWDAKRLKVEWRQADVAVFRAPYHDDSTPDIIVESKQLWHGLGDAPEQATSYAKRYPKTCKRVVVSDGITYKLFTKHRSDWRYTAYLDILSPRRKHPYERGVRGAVSFLLKLMPKRRK